MTNNQSKTTTLANQSPGTRYKLRSYDTIQRKRLRWYDKSKIVASGVTVIIGIGGRGKSALGIYYAARFSNKDVPGDYLGKKVATLIASAEDLSEQIIGPRLDSAGADGKHVYELRMSDGGSEDRLLSVPHDIIQMEDATNDLMAQGYEGVVIVIDPFKAHLSLDMDTNKETHMRAVLAALAQMAERTKAAVVLIDHPNKRSEALDLASRVGGAGTYNAVRSLLVFGKDPDNPDSPTLRLLAQGKHNWTGGGVPSDLMELVPDKVQTSDGMTSTVRLEHVGTSTNTFEDILEAESVRIGGEKYKWSKTAAAEHFILGLLWEDANGVPSEQVKEWASMVADCSTKTIERLGRQEVGTGKLALLKKEEVEAGKWVWRMPSLEEMEAEMPF